MLANLYIPNAGEPCSVLEWKDAHNGDFPSIARDEGSVGLRRQRAVSPKTMIADLAAQMYSVDSISDISLKSLRVLSSACPEVELMMIFVLQHGQHVYFQGSSLDSSIEVPNGLKPISELPLIQGAIAEHKLVSVEDLSAQTEAELGLFGPSYSSGISSLVLIPFTLCENAPTGALVVGRKSKMPLSEEGKTLLGQTASIVGGHVSMVMKLIFAQNRLLACQMQAQQSAVLRELSNALADECESAKIIQVMAKYALHLWSSEASLTFLMSNDSDMENFSVIRFTGKGVMAGSRTLRRDEIPRQHRLVANSIEYVDLRSLPGARPFLEVAHGTSEVVGLALQPVYKDEVFLGVLCLFQQTGSAVLRQEDFEVMGEVASMLASSLARARKFEALLQDRNRAESATRAKNLFVSHISHEMRTPLNAIVGMSSLLAETKLDSRQRDYLKSLQNSSSMLLALVNDTLDFGKIEAGFLSLERAPFNIRACVQSALDVISNMAAKKNLKLVADIDNNVSELVLGDFNRVRQILLNLLSNAVKFTHQGAVRLLVQRHIIDHTAVLKFAVEDTGVGIEASDMDWVFEPYQQVGKEWNSRRDGTGLGLQICKRLTEAMGGEIWLESAVEKGSTFHFVLDLPAVTERECQKPHADIEARQTSPGQCSTFSRRTPPALLNEDRSKPRVLSVLVAEDDAVNQKLIRRYLEKLGYAAVIVNNGEEVLQRLQTGHFDVVLMDLFMPVMTGFEAIKVLREAESKAHFPRRQVVIAVTASVDSESIRLLDLGFDDVIAKPFSLEHLMAKLQSVAL